jgi:two-component system, OmpR family, KDP operon response regulator KdpE
MKPPRALLLYDKNSDCQFLRATMVGEGCEVEEAPFDIQTSGSAASYCLVLVDIHQMTPRVLKFVRAWRDRAPEAMMLVAAARAADANRIAVLETGVDAYLNKPLEIRELRARIRSALRRFRPKGGRLRCFSVGDSLIDLEARLVHGSQGEIRLTPKERTILELLAGNRNETVRSSVIVETLWGADPRKGVHSLRLFIRRLRNKIEPDPSHPRFLVTDPAIGYRLQVTSEDFNPVL